LPLRRRSTPKLPSNLSRHIHAVSSSYEEFA
jgi:hypothetical protein